MSRSGARSKPPREAGVGFSASEQARRSEESIPGRVGPRRSQAGRLQKEKAPSARRRTAGPPWLGSPARHEPVRMSSSLIIQVAGNACNRWPRAIHCLKMPSLAKSSPTWEALRRSASAMLATPLVRRKPMVAFRRAAITWGPERFRIRLESSPIVTSRT